jgi:regulator of protease activity HflC (stomatin/prohibitin superfamily)
MAPILFGTRSESSGGSILRVNIIAIAILLASIMFAIPGLMRTGNLVSSVATILVGVVLMQSPRIAQQWERAVVLRLGRFVGLRGPGLFWIVPFIDRVSSWVDQRTITTGFAASRR